jgi:hypothetical protein
LTTSSLYHVAADAVVVLHLGFVVFVLFGGLFVLRWPALRWAHLPAAAWGIVIEFGGWMCPLTPLEIVLRRRAGSAAYQGDFVAHYIFPVLYPAGLTRTWQLALGVGALAINALIYALVVARRRGVKI